MITTTVDDCKLLMKSYIHLLCELEIPNLVIYPREMKTYVHKKTCKRRFTVSMVTIAKTWKRSGGPKPEEINCDLFT